MTYNVFGGTLSLTQSTIVMPSHSLKLNVVVIFSLSGRIGVVSFLYRCTNIISSFRIPLLNLHIPLIQSFIK